MGFKSRSGSAAATPEPKHCKQPDRDVPAIVCGYPLPCPWHTATIDLGADPPTVTVPITKFGNVGRLAQIADALKSGETD